MSESKSDARRVLEFLRDERARFPECLVESPWRKEVIRRGNFTMVKVQVWVPGNVIGEGIGFAKRNLTRRPVIDPETGEQVLGGPHLHKVWAWDANDPQFGEQVAMGKAMLDLAWALLKDGKVLITKEGAARWREEADDNDIPF